MRQFGESGDMVRRNTASELATGIFSLLLAHVLFGGVLFALGWIAQGTNFYFLHPTIAYAAVAIGLSQLLYAIPLMVFFRRRRRFNAAKGTIICAAITALLNGSCFIFVVWLFNSNQF